MRSTVQIYFSSRKVRAFHLGDFTFRLYPLPQKTHSYDRKDR